MHRYTAYGLDIASDIELPELVAAPDAPTDAEPDLRVRLGTTPETLDDPVESRVVWSARPGEWLQTIEGVGRYYIHNEGRELVIERMGGTDQDLRAFLFGTVIGAIFHQRGQFVLHACTVVMPDGGGAISIAGAPGAGKSTTLAALIDRGYKVLTDDKTVVEVDDTGATVLSGYPTMRLWRDAAERIGANPDELPPLREGMEKYLYRTDAFQHEPAPMRALVVLGVRSNMTDTEEGSSAETGGDAKDLAPGLIRSTEVFGHRAIRTVLRQTYRRRIVNGSGFQAEHFQWAANLTDTVSVVQVVRLRHSETVDAVADAVEAAGRAASKASEV